MPIEEIGLDVQGYLFARPEGASVDEFVLSIAPRWGSDGTRDCEHCVHLIQRVGPQRISTNRLSPLSLTSMGFNCK